MSLIANRERTLKCKTQSKGVKRISSGRMKSASSFADPRAWSMNPRKRTEYIFEAMAELATSSGSEDNAKETSEEPQRAPERNSGNRRRFLMNKGSFSADNILDGTDHELIKLNNKLFEAKEEIEELQIVNKNLISEKTKTNAEVDNLRDLVKNMTGQMEYLESLKASDSPSDAETELNSKKELERANLEIDHLSRKVEMFSNIRKWNEEIRRAHDKLTVEKTEVSRRVEERDVQKDFRNNEEIRRAHDKLTVEKTELSRRVEELQVERESILEKLSAKEKKVSGLESELKAAEESTTEKIVLRDRLAAKDEKIRELGVILEQQTVTVKELTAKVTSLTECFRNKEECLNQEVEELRKSLEEKSSLIAQLENKLHDTELLVAELETLRDQFRSTNIALTESIRAYKKDIDCYVSNSEVLTDTIKKLRSDNDAKEKEIEKLTLFPQNPDTMLYFSHLNKLVTSVEKLELLTKDQQADLLESVKSIIVKLKEEMWGGNITPMELQIQDSTIQTECDQRHRDVQCMPTVCSVLIQTALPDEYMLKFKKSEEEVTKLNTKIVAFEKTLSDQEVELDTLETSFFDVIEDNHTKDMTLERLARNNDLLQETLRTLNGELKNTDEMLMSAMREIQEQAQSHSSSRDILETTLKTTVEEYSKYVTVLEAYLQQKAQQITEIQRVVEQQRLVHLELSERTTKEVEDLRNLLTNEENISGKLKIEVSRLLGSLKEKSGLVQEMEIKLARAEKTIEKLIEDDEVYEETESEYPKDGSSDYVSSLGSQVASYKKQVAKYKSDIVHQHRVCEALEDEVKGLKRTKKYLKGAASRSCVQKRETAVRLRKVRSCLTKSRRRERLLKMEFARVDKSRSDLSESVDSLTAENGVLKTERSVLLQELYSLKRNLNELEKCMEKHKERYTLHEELKMKMEKQVLKLMKKITKYKTALSVKRDEEENASRSYQRAVISEKLNHEIDLLKTENMSLSTTICSLKQKLSSLFELPEKESSSVELQVSLEEQFNDGAKEQGSSGDVSSHYESIIAAMKREHESAADQSHRQYMNNLKMLKDTYERDIAGMRKSHSENLEKMKTMQLEELEFLHQKQKQAELELEKSKIEEIFAKEAADLRAHYEGCLKEKETHFENEKTILVLEMSAVKENLSKQVENSAEEIEKMKANFEHQVGKLEELQRIEVELLKRRFEKSVDREIEKRMRERRERMDERETQCDSMELEDRGTDPDLDITTRESCTNTESCSIVQTISEVNCQERVSCEIKEESSKTILSVVPVMDTEDFSKAPERALLMSRIEDLENRLQSQQTESARKLKFYDKRVKHEQMKAREIANILDQELRYSTDVHCKLGLQYNRAEQLELEKEMLASRLQLCEQELNLIKNMKEDEKFHAITSTFLEGIADPESSLELEQSLNRLKLKIDQAEIHEQRLSDEMQKKCEPTVPKYECGVDHVPHKEYEEVVHNDRGSPDLKVIVIQQRKVTHSWSSQFDDVY